MWQGIPPTTRTTTNIRVIHPVYSSDGAASVKSRLLLNQRAAAEVKNVCHFFYHHLLFLLPCEGSKFWCPVATWLPRPPTTPHPPPPGGDRLAIFPSPVPKPHLWQLSDEHILALSANVWVYWCAVTGPSRSHPTCIKASCCFSSVSPCVPPPPSPPAPRRRRLRHKPPVNTGCSKQNAPSPISPRPNALNTRTSPAPTSMSTELLTLIECM